MVGFAVASFISLIKNNLKKYLFLAVFVSLLSVAHFVSASVLYSDTLMLSPGWNIVSTPKVLDSHSFSLPETSDNFDIYALNASSTSGWSTLASLGQTEFTPLFGYFINNKSTTTQSLTFNYKAGTTPNERLFERTFPKTGWYSIGVANPTYAILNPSESDINNPSKILNAIFGGYDSVIDMTDDSGSSLDDKNAGIFTVGKTWKQAVVSDVDNLMDFSVNKGYVVYIKQVNSIYSGFQNANVLQPSISVISPSLGSTFLPGQQVPLSYFVNNFPRAINVAFQLNKNATYPSGPYNPVSATSTGYIPATGNYLFTIPAGIETGNDYSISIANDYPTTETSTTGGHTANFTVVGPIFTLVNTPSISKSVIGQTASSTFSTGFTFDVTALGKDLSIASSGAFFIDVYVNNASVVRLQATYAEPVSGITTDVNGNYLIADGDTARFTAQASFVGPAGAFVPAGGILTARLSEIHIINSNEVYTSISDTFRTDSSATVTL